MLSGARLGPAGFCLPQTRRLSLAGLALLVAGCTQAPHNGELSPPSVATPYGGVPAPGASIFATELAGPQTYLPPLPTAVVLLRPDDMKRNRAFCQAALQLPTAQQAEAATVVAPNLIRTRWLVQLADIPPDRARDCDFLTGTYDYARAARLTASIQLTFGNLAGRGPYLLMFVPDSSGLRVAGLNGSATADIDMATFLHSWGGALTRAQTEIAARQAYRPGVVRSVFDLVGAILRAAVGGATGLVTGVLDGA